MTKLVDRFSIFFSSKDAIVQSPNASFTVVLDPSTIRTDDTSFMKISISQVIIQNTLMDVTIYNRNLIWNGFEIQLPLGNPSWTQLIDMLASYGLIFVVSNNRLLFSCTGVLEFPNENSACTLFGFNQGIYAIEDGYIPQERVMLGRHDQIYLRSSVGSNNLEIDSQTGDTIYSNILCSIANVAKPNQLLVFEDVNGCYSILKQNINTLNHISVALTDEKGLPCVIDGIWSVALSVEIIEDNDTEVLESIKSLNKTMSELLHLTKMKFINKNINTSRKRR